MLRDVASGVVRLQIAKSNVGEVSFDDAITWDLRGRRIAAVESDNSGKRGLVLLNRDLAFQNQSNAGVDARIPLPIEEAISSLRYISDTQIRIEGATKVYEQVISAHGRVTAGPSYFVAAAASKQITVKDGSNIWTVGVEAWACH
jgi:hypothetical protein